MKFSYLFLLFFTIITSVKSFESFLIANIAEITNIVNHVVEWTSRNEPLDSFMEFSMDDITIQISEVSNNLQPALNSKTLINELSPESRLFVENQLNDIIKYQNFIDNYYYKMEMYITHWPKISNKTLIGFCEKLIKEQEIDDFMAKIYSYLIPKNRGLTTSGLLSTIFNAKKEDFQNLMLNLHLSNQQLLFYIYKFLSLGQVKGYVTMQFAYRILQYFEVGTYKEEIEISTQIYKNNISNITQIFKTAISNASSSIWRKDPEKHIKAETYEDIKGLVQGTALNLESLTKDGKCYKSCEDIKTVTKVQCRGDEICKSQNCKGAVRCQTMAWDSEICYDGEDSPRKYTYIQNGGQIWGNKSACSKIDTFTGKTRLFEKCYYCMCTCIEVSTLDLPPEVYINLRGVIANISYHKVVTGLRFVKNNDIIHIQIQEGKLQPYGKIDRYSIQWVPVENYTVMDRNIKKGQDYHKLTWNSRAFDLDDLEAKEGHAVTGVRLRVVKGHIKLEMYTSPIDYTLGLIIDTGIRNKYTINMKSPTSLKNPRTEVKLFKPDIPTKDNSQSSLMYSMHNQYIKFDITDLEKDAGQTVVPYFDCQPVDSVVPHVLQGIGVFHKAKPGYGGFIALKIITFDVSKFMYTDF